MKIGTVWDRTLDVIAGRAAILTTIAALTMLLPSVVSEAIGLALGQAGAPRPVTAILGIITFALSLWGSLSLTAVASDPAIDRDGALRRGAIRLPLAIGIVLLLGIGFAVLFLPAIFLLVGSGIDLAVMEQGVIPSTGATAGLGGFALFSLVYAVFVLWAAARLFLLYPVLVNEPAGLRSIVRAFALTRGLALRILGVLILYAIVFGVTFLAATAITGVVFRLILGGGQAALVAFLIAIAGGLVTAAFGVLQSVFSARLYVAAREAREGSLSVK